MNVVLLVAELGVIGLFAAVARLAWVEKGTDNGRSLGRLLSAAFYAVLFEDLNVRQVHGRGSYFYNADFIFDIDQVPLFIVLAWAVILWGAMRLSDTLPLRPAARVAADGALAVLLDLGFDVTAIRHQFWTWRGFDFDQAWFGVPAGNFFGWLWVSLAFAALTRMLEENTAIKARVGSRLRRLIARLFYNQRASPLPRAQRAPAPTGEVLLSADSNATHKPSGSLALQLCAVPLLAFVAYRAVESATNHLLVWSGLTGDYAALGVFFGVLALVVAFSIAGRTTDERLPEPHFVAMSRASFHIFAVLGLLTLPNGAPGTAQRPVLLMLAGLCWLGDATYQRVLRREPGAGLTGNASTGKVSSGVREQEKLI